MNLDIKGFVGVIAIVNLTYSGPNFENTRIQFIRTMTIPQILVLK